MTERLSVLVVEDEPLIAMMIEDFLDVLGHELAGISDTIADARGRVAQGGFDVAILDVNLADGPCWPVADALAERGVPFVLASGGHVDPPPATHVDAPTLAKPFTLDGIETALAALAAG